MVSDMTQPATAELDVERSLSPPNEQLSCHWEIGNVAVNSEGCQPRATAVLDTFMFVSLVCFCSVCFSYQSYLIFRKKTKEICNETQCHSMRASLKLSHPQYALIIVALSSMHHALVPKDTLCFNLTVPFTKCHDRERGQDWSFLHDACA